MPLGTQVSLGLGHVVLDGYPAPQKGHNTPIFGPCLLGPTVRLICKFQRVSRLVSVTARHSSSGRQPNSGVQQRAPPIFGRAAITLGIGPHF